MWSMKKVKENSRRAKKWNTRGANADERQQEETERRRRQTSGAEKKRWEKNKDRKWNVTTRQDEFYKIKR